jgi:putative restriction endonuclease
VLRTKVGCRDLRDHYSGARQTVIMSEWLERVQNLRVWSQDGVRAPHKPLLLLIMLARIQGGRFGPIPYVDLERPLADFAP